MNRTLAAAILLALGTGPALAQDNDNLAIGRLAVLTRTVAILRWEGAERSAPFFFAGLRK